MPAGRPRRVTPDLVERAAELRRDGLGVEAIAERLELSLRSTFRALALARDGLPQVPAAQPVLLAEAPLVASVERAAQGDWRAAAWLLERIAPERWDRTYRPVPAPTSGGAFAEVDELARRRRTGRSAHEPQRPSRV